MVLSHLCAITVTLVLVANSHSVVWDVPTNTDKIVTHYGQAIGMFVVVTVPHRGTLHFAVLANVYILVGVMEVSLDRTPVLVAAAPLERFFSCAGTSAPSR